MENLNAEQIKKALECCSKANCVDCPYREDIYGITCGADMPKDALALINSQEQRIKELAEELDDAKRDTIPKLRLSLERANAMGVEADKTIEKLAEENERLKTQKYMAYPDGRLEMIPTVESVKADTVRKMQNELKKTFSAICKGEMVDLYRIIDQIAKELTESGDG